MRKLIRHLFFIFKKLAARWKRIRYLLLPNVAKVIDKKITFSRGLPNCDQMMIVSGKGKVHIGEGCSFGYRLGGFHRGGCIELQARYANAVIRLGNNVMTNNNIFICSANSIEIGDDTLIGQYVTIFDFEAHGIKPSERRNIGEIGSVRIGRNVWIGNNVLILKNTTIGDDSIVAAGAVVSGDFPAGMIIGGVPAKAIKRIS